MPETDVGQTVTVDVESHLDDYSVSTETTDGALGTQETTYTNEDWSQQLGYYKNIPELTNAIDITPEPPPTSSKD